MAESQPDFTRSNPPPSLGSRSSAGGVRSMAECLLWSRSPGVAPCPPAPPRGGAPCPAAEAFKTFLRPWNKMRLFVLKFEWREKPFLQTRAPLFSARGSLKSGGCRALFTPCSKFSLFRANALEARPCLSTAVESLIPVPSLLSRQFQKGPASRTGQPPGQVRSAGPGA